MEGEATDFCLFGMDLHILTINMIVLLLDFGIRIWKNQQENLYLFEVLGNKIG